MVVTITAPTFEVITRGWFPAPLLVVPSLGGIASLSGITGFAVVVCLFV